MSSGYSGAVDVAQRELEEAQGVVFKRQPSELSEKTTSTRDESKAERPEGWASCVGFERVANFRDCAGPDASAPYRCSKGGRLRSGLLFRTGHLVAATEHDLALLRGPLGVRTYLDLRSGKDFESVDSHCYDDFPPSPCGRHDANVPRRQGEMRRVSCPFTKDLSVRPLSAHEQAAVDSRTPPLPRKPLETGADRSGDIAGMKAECELWFQRQMRSESLQVQLYSSMRAMLIINDDEVLKAMRILTEKENYPVAFGCSAGKDRTGLLACLVHGALGLSEEDIIADYLLTNDAAYHINACNQVAGAMWFEEMKIRDPQRYDLFTKRCRLPTNLMRLLDSGPETPLWEDVNIQSDPTSISKSMVHSEVIEYILNDVLDSEFGGVLGYLEYIGFGQDEVERLREVLVEADSS